MEHANSDKEIKRPFRLWDANAGTYLRWRYYKESRNAHLGALIEARWAKPGFAVEVLDIRTNRVVGQYKRTPTSVIFAKG